MMRLRLDHRTHHFLVEENAKAEPTRHSPDKTQANTDLSTKLTHFIQHSGMSINPLSNLLKSHLHLYLFNGAKNISIPTLVHWPWPSIRESRNELTYQLLVDWIAPQMARSYYIIIDKYYNHWQSVLSTTYSLLIACFKRLRSNTDTIHFSVSRIGLQESDNWTYPLPSIPSPIEWTGR